MKLSDFVVREAIIVDLKATGKEETIREIVGSLCLAGALAEADADGVARAILNREELGSTGIGQGVAVLITIPGLALAIPHFGINGAAVVSVLAYGITMLILLTAATRRFGGSYASFLIVRLEDLRLLRHQVGEGIQSATRRFRRS